MLGLLSKWKLILGGGVVIVLVGLLVASRIATADARADANRYHEQLLAERASHEKTKLSYRTAELEAKAQDLLNQQRVKAEQEQITQGIVVTYEDRIADIRSRFDKLVRGDDPNGQGGAGATSVPAVPDATARAHEAAGENAVPAALTLNERRIAEETAARLIGLQDWVKQQTVVDLTGPQQEVKPEVNE